MSVLCQNKIAADVKFKKLQAKVHDGSRHNAMGHDHMFVGLKCLNQ